MKENRKNFSFVLRVLCLIVSAAITAQFIVPKVYAWFLNKNDRDLTITGSVRRTYFERGSGTASYPYVIARPLQLYYLAWLQDMGVFNQDLDNDGTLDTFYFELGCMNGQDTDENMEIDMSGMTLPPIGTTTYPFVSSFNGNGRTISNLTVSNNEDALTDMPTNSIPDTATTNAPILGMFGVVGGYTSTTGYSPPEKSVYDVILEDITIDNISPAGNQALAGLAAGYVNGVMENVTVTGTSTINNTSGITAMSFGNDTRTTLSDYALAGYCTEAYRDLLKREDVKVYNPTVEISDLSTYGEIGQGSAWGNSIDMKSMYDRLLGIYTPLENNNSYTARYPSSVLVTIDRTGASEVRTEEILQLAADIPTVGSNNKVLNFSNDYSSYSFIERTKTHDYMYLYGKSRQQTNRTVNTTNRYIERAYRIHQDSNYLKFNGTAFSNTTTASEATGWIIDSSGRIYTALQNGNTYIYYFLINNGNTLGYQAVNANSEIPASVTEWTVTETAISSNGYYLNYDGTWKLMQQVSITDEPEEGAPHFMTVQNNTIQNTSSDPIMWNKTVIDTVDDKERFTISCNIGSTTYYLTQHEGELELTANAASPTLWLFKEAVHESLEEDDQPAKIYTLIEGDEEGNGYALYYDEEEDNWLLTDFQETASGSGIGNEWGVSIPMKEMYTNLLYILQNNLATTNYVASKTIEIDDKTGQITERDHVNSTLPTIVSDDGTFNRKHYIKEGFGEFTYTDGKANRFMYMTDMQNSTAIKYVHLLDEERTANYIKIGNNYLKLNENQNGLESSNEAAATKWVIDESGHIYVDVEGTTSVERRYLNASEGILTATNTASTIWTYDDVNNRLYCTSDDNTYYLAFGSQWMLKRENANVIYVSDENGQWYLNISGDTLSTVGNSDEATDFIVNGNTIVFYEDNTTYSYRVEDGRIIDDDNNKMLDFENGEFVWKDAYDYIIKYNNNFISLSNNSISNVTNINSATHWTLTDSGDGFTISSGNYSLGVQQQSSFSWSGYSYTYRFIDSETIWIRDDSNLYVIQNEQGAWGSSSNKKYYLNYSNGWTLNQNSGNAQLTKQTITSNVTTANVQNTTRNPGDTAYGMSVQRTDTTYRPFTVTMGSEPVGQTYFPLQIDVDSSKTGADRFSVNPLNTGYVISGYTNGFGDIRVSEYPKVDSTTQDPDKKRDIEASLTNNKNALDPTKVYTFMDGKKQTLSNYGLDKLVKYEATSEEFNNTINGVNNVYGLHFMNASISINNLVTAPSVTINENVYENYQMPKDSIDFRLKDKGYINFLAGTYYTNNNSFFSLHRIERDENNDISSIKEILEIYGTGKRRDPYIYKFSDTDYESWSYYKSGNIKEHHVYNSLSELPDGYESIFNTAWIKKQSLTNNVVYYFEIPTDAGEYALGSVNVGTGAYLLYLDIGTGGSVKAPEGNAKFTNTVPTAVSRTETTLTYEENLTETTSVALNSYPTYFPLTLNSDETGVSDANTGYVVSGANYPGNDPPGDIRVSRYNSDPYISNSLTSGSLDNRKILTIGANGQQILTQYGIDRFYKYQTAKSQLQETLDAGNGKIYGLHFMNAEISKNHLVTLPSATINGQTYTNYTVPEDCIDFTLRSQGYINFFAGSYFSGSNVQCFFSLHQIFRNEQNEITEIKEIKEIYKNTDGTYIYRYNGENAPSSGTKVFDTAWLTDPSNIIADRVYYFEIPVNAGEYALGSVAGKNGAYLLYLDISTHQGDSILTREKMEIITTTYLLPAGVRFSDDEYKAYIIPITQTGNIEIVSEDQTVTSDPALSDTSTSETRLVETVTIKDYAGTLMVQRITDGNNVTYYRGTDTEHLNASTAQICSRYFADTASDTILEYYYYPEAENTVLNTASPAYTIEDEIIITAYNVTASAASAALTATVTAFDSDKSYLKFQNRHDLVEGDTVTISARSP
ncbi:hypothetical protein [Ruminococcus albus]|uniref:hypothetical protein n=1 Tax=Ruminococcus albus TaxID=1264 RepID=UPI0004637D57|nr:hypothetical protein [Ruminococcus albus]